MDNETRLSSGLVATLEIAGVLVVGWGMLLFLTLGLTVTGVASTVFFSAYGVAIIRATRRAVALGWSATVFMAVAVLVGGFEPILALVWSWFFVLSMFLTDSRDRLKASALRCRRGPQGGNDQASTVDGGSAGHRHEHRRWNPVPDILSAPDMR